MTLDVYLWGMVSLSICAPEGATKEEIEEAANLQHPTGISSHWQIAEEDYFASGESMPHPCERKPGFQHWLLHC